MVDDKLCEKCKNQLFESANPVICEQCAERFFRDVKKYIDTNPDNSLKKVAEETGVDKHYIKKWIREGRIQYSSPEETERKRKLENLKRDYQKLLEEEEEKKKHRESQQGRYHTRDFDNDKTR